MNYRAVRSAVIAAMSILALHTKAQSQSMTGNVVQGATNVIIVNNGLAGGGNLPTPTTGFEALPLPIRPVHGRSLWAHNSSVMALEAQGNQRRFYYHRPRAGLASAGARPGSLLFEGARFGNSYAGTARVFAGPCGVYEYEVSGPVIADRRVVVHGMAPRVNQNDCRIQGYRTDTLVFDLI